MKFTVKVTRTSYASIDYNVDADNIEAAKDKALELAQDSLFSEHSSVYEADARMGE